MRNNGQGIQLPYKGMDRDSHPSRVDESSYVFAKNVSIEDSSGNGMPMIQNEPSNLLCNDFKFYDINNKSNEVDYLNSEEFKIVGYKYNSLLDRVYYFLAGEGSMEGISVIGYSVVDRNISLDDDIVEQCGCGVESELSTPLENLEQTAHCKFYVVVDDYCNKPDYKGCLKLSIDYPIQESNIVFKNEQCGVRMYWTDGVNPPRFLDVEVAEEPREKNSYYVNVVEDCDGNVEIGENDGCFDCDKIKLIPDYEVPCLKVDSIVLGGNLKMGNYEFLIAYCDEAGNEMSDYHSHTNTVNIFDYENIPTGYNDTDRHTNYGIKLNVDKLDGRFSFYKVVVIERSSVDGAEAYYEEGIHPITDSSILYTTNKFKKATTLNKIFVRRFRVDRVENMSESNGYLFLGGLKHKRTMNLQPVVNFMGSYMKWVSYSAEEDFYKSGVNAANYRGYMRDEVYPFAITFILKDGSRTNDFILSNRFITPGDTIFKEGETKNIGNNFNYLGDNIDNCIDVDRRVRWQYFNTADASPSFVSECDEDYGDKFSYVNRDVYKTFTDYPNNENVVENVVVKVSPEYNPSKTGLLSHLGKELLHYSKGGKYENYDFYKIFVDENLPDGEDMLNCRNCENPVKKDVVIGIKDLEVTKEPNIVYSPTFTKITSNYEDISFPEGMRMTDDKLVKNTFLTEFNTLPLSKREPSEKGMSCSDSFKIENDEDIHISNTTSLTSEPKLSRNGEEKLLTSLKSEVLNERLEKPIGTVLISSEDLRVVHKAIEVGDTNVYASREKWGVIYAEDYFPENITSSAIYMELDDVSKYPFLQLNFASDKIVSLFKDSDLNGGDSVSDMAVSDLRKVRLSVYSDCNATAPSKVVFCDLDEVQLFNIKEDLGVDKGFVVIDTPLRRFKQGIISFDRYVDDGKTYEGSLSDDLRTYEIKDGHFVYPSVGKSIRVYDAMVTPYVFNNLEVSSSLLFGDKELEADGRRKGSKSLYELVNFEINKYDDKSYLSSVTEWSIGAYQRHHQIEYYEYTIDRVSSYKKVVYNAMCKRPRLQSCGISYHNEGSFAYWQSTEEYPTNDELFNSYKHAKDSNTSISDLREIFERNGVKDVEGSVETFINNYGESDGMLCNKDKSDFTCSKIRHFKFPDNKVVPFISDGGINILGVKLDNQIINSFLDLAVSFGLIDQEQRDSIVSYELKRGDRRMDKSILSKGLLTDVMKYKEEHNITTDNEYYYPNYLLNTLGQNSFINQDTHPGGGKFNDRFVFNSPELLYNVSLDPTEISVEGVQLATSEERFHFTERHPKWIILSDRGFDVADKFAAREVVAENMIKFADLIIQAVDSSGGGFDKLFFEANISGQSNGSAKGGSEDKKDPTSAKEESAANVVIGTLSAGSGLNGLHMGKPGTDSSGGTRKWAYWRSIAMAVSTMVQIVKRWSDRRAQLRNQWLDIIKAKGSGFNFCTTISGLSDYNDFKYNDFVGVDGVWRHLVKKGVLGEGMFTIKEGSYSDKFIRLNNIDREKSLYIKTHLPVHYTESFIQQNNTYNLLDDNVEYGSKDDIPYRNNVGNFYTSLKVWKPAQYGQIYDIKWIDVRGNCCSLVDGSDCETYWGGDTYISKFAYKRKFNYFLVSSMLQGDFNTPFKYSSYFNIKNANFYVDYETEYERLGWSDIKARMSNHKLFGVKEEGNYITGGRFFHYHYNIPYFFVESDINCWNRYRGDELWEDFYPNFLDINRFTQEYHISIRRNEKFLYNNTYSVPGVSMNNVFLPENYDRFAYDCMNDSPNGVMYSLQDSEEKEKVDPWLVYRHFDYYNFPADYGKLIMMKGLESVQMMGLFENTAVIFNAIDVIKDRVNPENVELGTGGIFASRPISFHKTDLGYAGTQHKMVVSCEFGHFWVDAKRGQVFQVEPNGSGLKEITVGLRNWFKEQLPFKILKGNIEGLDELSLDNTYKGLGISMGWDSRFKRLFLTKLDYVVNEPWVGKIKFVHKGEEDYNTQNNLLFLKKGYSFYIEENGEDVEISLDDTRYFTPAHFTMAYSPMTQSWISYYDFHPSFYIPRYDYFETGGNNLGGVKGTWSHLLTNKSYGVFYGKKYPWKLEIVTKEYFRNGILSDVEFWLDNLRYHNAFDYAYSSELSLDSVFIYNHKVSSGKLELVPKQKNNLYQYTQYPKIVGQGSQILVTYDEGKWSFNDFYDRVRKDNVNVPLWNYDVNMIDKTPNLQMYNYQSRWLDRLRGDWFLMRFEGGGDTRYKQIFKWLVPKTDIVI